MQTTISSSLYYCHSLFPGWHSRPFSTVQSDDVLKAQIWAFTQLPSSFHRLPLSSVCVFGLYWSLKLFLFNPLPFILGTTCNSLSMTCSLPLAFLHMLVPLCRSLSALLLPGSFVLLLGTPLWEEAPQCTPAHTGTVFTGMSVAIFTWLLPK